MYAPTMTPHVYTFDLDGDSPSLDVNERLRAVLLNTDGFRQGPLPDAASLGPSAPSDYAPAWSVTVRGGTVFVASLLAAGGPPCGFHGDALAVSVLAVDQWLAGGRPGAVRPLDGRNPPRFVCWDREAILARSSGATDGGIDGAPYVTLADAAAVLDGVTPYVWAIENDRGAAPLEGSVPGKRGVWTSWFNVIVVV